MGYDIQVPDILSSAQPSSLQSKLAKVGQIIFFLVSSLLATFRSAVNKKSSISLFCSLQISSVSSSLGLGSVNSKCNQNNTESSKSNMCSHSDD